jgi:hypothetical protein
MKINYKVLCLDDKPKEMGAIMHQIKKVLEDNFFIPVVPAEAAIFTSYKQASKHFGLDISPIDSNKFFDVDLLLVDWNIADASEDGEIINGEAFIKRLREGGILTDVVFYSGAMNDRNHGYKAKVKERLLKTGNIEFLDNVVYADKDGELMLKVEDLIKKKITQGMNTSNLRGYLMDATSDFDLMRDEKAVNLFSGLTPNNMAEVIYFVRAYVTRTISPAIGSSARRSVIAAIAIESSADLCTELSNDCFRNIDISPRQKFRVFAKIVRMAGKSVEADKISTEAVVPGTGFVNGDQYYNDIVDGIRNEFAHKKLDYGKCYKNIVLMDTSAALCGNPCAGTCCHVADKIFTYEECLKIREKIFKFYLLFNSI